MSTKLILCFHDQDKTKPKLTFKNPSEERLCELNSNGYGIFETANSFSGTKRRKEHLSRLDEVFADMDVCKDGDGTSEPEREEKKERLKNAIDAWCPASIYVVTKNGLQPRWWINESNTDRETLQKYESIINGIIEFSKMAGSLGDPVKDVTRVLRKPGYYHLKSEPYLVTEVLGCGKTYTLDELRKYFWEEPVVKSTSNQLTAPNPIDAIDIRIVVADVWKERGHIATFDAQDHLVIDGVITATYKDHLGKNFIATTSSDYPAKGNATTYVAETLGITTKEAWKWLENKYGRNVKGGRESIGPKSSGKELIVGSTRATMVCMADVRPEPISWLWQGRIAIGKLSIISGDPGLGKSLLTAKIAATVSTGSKWPLEEVPCQVGSVVFLSAEDDPADTIRPRLDAAGADCARIHVLKAISEDDTEGRKIHRMFSFKRDLEALSEILKELPDCKLLVIDPISAYLDGADSHNNTDVRGLLAPLAELAIKHKVAVLMVQHMNKNSSNSAMYRSMGSVAFTAAARSAYVVTKDKNDPDRRLVMPVKNNLAKDVTGLAYSVMQADNGAPSIVWESEPVTMTADEALETNGNGEHTETDWAVEFLQDLLISGPVAASEVIKQARKYDFSQKTLRRAREKLKVTTTKSTYLGGWVWGLPDEDALNAEEAPF
jgi:putative DNA primase/helicase